MQAGIVSYLKPRGGGGGGNTLPSLFRSIVEFILCGCRTEVLVSFLIANWDWLSTQQATHLRSNIFSIFKAEEEHQVLFFSTSSSVYELVQDIINYKKHKLNSFQNLWKLEWAYYLSHQTFKSYVNNN